MTAAHHLSYPFVFVWEGVLYMTPEQAPSGRIDLYRCERVPDGWVRQTTLLDGVRAIDPTLLHRDGRWWLFFCAKHDGPMGAAYHLHLRFADRLEGPWTAHPQNPVLVDVQRARPAGPFYEVAGRLYRPSQDGSGGYGRAVIVNEVETLTPQAYAERPIVRLRGVSERGATATHHLCRRDGMVAVDEAHRSRRV